MQVHKLCNSIPGPHMSFRASTVPFIRDTSLFDGHPLAQTKPVHTWDF